MESWHAQLQKCLTMHLNIFGFIHRLKICNASAKINLSKAAAGATPLKESQNMCR